jgi:HK97 family phage portal protein
MDQALRVSAVWACVRLISQTVSMMPLHAFTLQSGVRVPIPDPPLLVRPSADASPTDFVSMLMTSLLLRGNAYGRITGLDGVGKPANIELMNPDKVSCKQDPETGATVYRAQSGMEIPRGQIWHVRAFRVPGSPVGLSPIQYAAQQINTDTAISNFALGYFNDAPHPSSVLTSDQSINQEQARTIKERFLSSVNGREPLMLGAGLKFSTLSVSPEESQFLATQKLGVASIARIFGVPPEMIAAEAGNSMTYTSMEAKGIDFLTYSIQWWLTQLESEFAALMPGKKHARFDTGVLLRTDLETRIKSGAIAIASKQQTPDEVRAWEGNDMPPLTPEQIKFLELVPLTVSPTGLPKSTMPKSAPIMNEAIPEGDPAA